MVEMTELLDPFANAKRWSREVRLVDTITGEERVFISVRKCAKHLYCDSSNVADAIKRKRLCRGRYLIELTGYDVLCDNDGVVVDRRKIWKESDSETI